MVSNRLIVVYQNRAEVVILDSDYKYLSDYTETEIAQQIWRELKEMKPDAEIPTYEHVPSKFEVVVKFSGTPRDALMFAAGSYGEHTVITEHDYERELDKRHAALAVGTTFVARYNEALERGSDPAGDGPEPVIGE